MTALWIEVLLGMISERKKLEGGCCWHVHVLVPIEKVFAWAGAQYSVERSACGTEGKRDAKTIWGFCADVRRRGRLFSVEPWSFSIFSFTACDKLEISD